MLVNKLAYRYRLARDLARDVVRGRRSRLDVVMDLLYRLARLAERIGPPRSARGCRRIVHVSPCYFGDESIVGGGERYAVELAAAMAEHADVTLVAFGPRRRSFCHRERLRVEIFPARRYVGGNRVNPVSFRFLGALRRADVIHCHQHQIVLTDLCTLVGAILRRRVFVTDLGFTSEHYGDRYPLSDFVDGFLAISEFAAARHREMLVGSRQKAVGSNESGASSRLPTAHCPLPTVLTVGGGVDVEALRPDPVVAKVHALFVGRLLPHKGIDDLVEGIPADVPLRIVGRPYHEEYLGLLQRLAAGKQVEFLTKAGDEDVRQQYQSAFVTVLPSVYRDVYGAEYDRPELLGLVLLESMACGTPVICTRVGAMPEVVEEGVTGFVVPPNDPAALRDRVRRLAADPELVRRMGAAGRRCVEQQWSWERVAQRCLEAYRRP